MKILAIDIGSGTQDIMIYDSEKELENSIKLVLPSPHIKISQTISKTDNNIYFTGKIMGGGKIKQSILKHMKKGYEVVMEEKCSKTIRDDINQVKSYGIKIADKNEDYSNYTNIKLGDLNIDLIKNFIKNYDIDFDFDSIAVAVQDHGYSSEMGDRDFRFKKISEKLKEPITPYEFAFTGDIPDYYTRMCEVKKSINFEKPTLIMDTKFASIAGMNFESNERNLNSYIVIDIGNGHTTAASIENGKIQGLFEHHTSSLTGESLERYIKRLASGEITNKEVYEDHGHGAHVINPLSELEEVVVSGPKRGLIKKTSLKYHNSTPAGDVMMTGTVGLIKTMRYNNA